MAIVIAVCKSDQKGTRKEDVSEGFLEENYGFIGDAHAARCTHRQLSLLAIESINKMRSLGFDISPGDFAENITTQGLEPASLSLGTRISIGKDITLEVTQIGKECHGGCSIHQQIGKCIMPRDGVFTRVINSGLVRKGDPIRIEKDG